MRLSLAAFTILFIIEKPIEAEVRTFPYEAVVHTDQVEIYSGSGYYATGRLNRLSRVTVYRHDPGGWYVIAPPPGSFSWIRAEYVQQSSGRIGTLTANNVLVRVGSSLSNSRDVYQEKLSKNDRVEILGEQTIPTEQGPVRMFKITPPRGERRWILGKYVTPVDEIARQQNGRILNSVPADTRNPFKQEKSPDDRSQYSTAAKSSNSATGPSGSSGNVSVKSKLQTASKTADRHQTLEQLDQQFRSIIEQDTGEWDFDQLESGYLALKKNLDDEVFASHLDQRLVAVKRYRRLKQQYDEFLQLKTKTTDREIQLLAMQNKNVKDENKEEQTSQPQAPILLAPQSQQVPPPIPVSPQPQPRRSNPVPVLVPGRAVRSPGVTISGPQEKIASVPMFAGAGIIQRTTLRYPGAPKHVLTAPDGRILAYLKGSWGVSLNRFVGQAVGVNGSRSYHPGLRSQLIRVRSLRPVRLSR